MYKILKKLIEMDDYSIQRLSSRSKLPKEYKKLDYIESNGTQYIDTGLIGSDLTDSEVELTIKNNTTGLNDYNFNGAYQVGKITQMGTVATSNTTCRCTINFGFTVGAGTDGLDITKFHKLYAKNGLQKVNDTQVGTTSFGSLNDYPFLLFARTNILETTTSIDYNKGSSISSFWVKKNGKYIRNLVPCYRKSDNEVGMYDLSATSKNLFDYKSVYSAYIDGNGNITTTANNLSSWNYFTEDDIGKTITVSLYVSSISANYIRVQGLIDGNYITGNAINAGSTGYTEITVTPSSTSDRWRITYGTGTLEVVLNQVMVSVSSTLEDYEPYQKRFYTNDGTGTFGYEYKGEKVEPTNVSSSVNTLNTMNINNEQITNDNLITNEENEEFEEI